MIRTDLPLARPGMRIGLLGGSFDPPHSGHALITRRALAALGLDRVWWLVSPGNPLKTRGPADIALRMAAARALMHDPRVDVTDIETRLKARYTVETLTRIKAAFPGVRFVWLMGADNMASFHKWRRWQDIARLMPIAVIARPGAQIAAACSPAARRFAFARVAQARARTLPGAAAPAWALLTGPMSAQSSTMIRRAGNWSESVPKPLPETSPSPSPKPPSGRGA
jgi:nicotinate-nucleotide adenylyltransferase